LAYLLLCLNPVAAAAGAIAIRKMSKLSELTVTFYCNLSLILLSIFLILVVGSKGKANFVGFNFWKDCDNVTLYVLFPVNAVTTILA